MYPVGKTPVAMIDIEPVKYSMQIDKERCSQYQRQEFPQGFSFNDFPGPA
jgi:hypothetical protein